MSKILIALGGNALGNTPEEQKRLVELPAKKIAELSLQGHQIIVGHGNGPQVGMIFNAFSDSHKLNPAHPSMMLPEAGGMSQGYIGFHMISALTNAYARLGVKKDVVYFLTETVVDKNDIAFKNPSKPVGPFYQTEEEAISSNPGSVIVEDAGRGYRKVVASPKPVNFVGIETIKKVVDTCNATVIVGGGGGVPMIEDDHGTCIQGVDGVIDKDLALSKIADMVDADILVILTAVKWVYVNYRKPDEKKLENVTVSELKNYLDGMEFASGSMKPKIEASIKFVEADCKRVAYIGDLNDLSDILAGKCGTKITVR